jgi:ABC-type polysaccharide/polyol phosphate transport system ATPase subunit
VSALPPGAIQLDRVSRSYRLLVERNITLKEALLRRSRIKSRTVLALDDVTLDIDPGTSLGVVGANGAGKSTLLKLVAGILPPNTGAVRTRGRVVSLLELGAGFHPDFTGRENVVLNASIHGIGRAEIARRMDRIVDFAELENFIDAPVRAYSSGMYARLGFSVACELEPDVLLLDEILAVGDVAFQNKCLGRIAEFQRRGVTIVFVSHASAVVETVCTRAIWLSGGKVLADGRPGAVLEEYHRSQTAAGSEGERLVESREWYMARILAVRCGDGEHVSDRFVCGDRFHLVVDYETSTTTPVVVGFVIRTVDGVIVGGSDSRADLRSGTTEPGRHTVEFSIPALPLLEGRFAIDVLLTSATGELLQQIDWVVEFSVFPDGRGIGPVAFRGEWQVLDEPRAPLAMENDLLEA